MRKSFLARPGRKWPTRSLAATGTLTSVELRLMTSALPSLLVPWTTLGFAPTGVFVGLSIGVVAGEPSVGFVVESGGLTRPDWADTRGNGIEQRENSTSTAIRLIQSRLLTLI